MDSSGRRKPCALIIFSLLVSVCVGESLAQAPVPLRVDPVLLGLPPAKPAPVPLPKAEKQESVEKTKTSAAVADPVDILPVERAVVESRPIDAADRVLPPSRVVPVEQNAVARPVQKPVSGAAETAPDIRMPPAAGAQPPRPPPPRATEPPADKPPAVAVKTSDGLPAGPAPAPVSGTVPAATPASVQGSTAKTTTLAPLKVDPVLLGLPPAAAVASPTPPAAQPVVPALAATPAPVQQTVEASRETKPLSVPAGPVAKSLHGQGRAQSQTQPQTTSSMTAKVDSTAAPASTQASNVIRLAPLKVDPALLGMPSAPQLASTAGSATQGALRAPASRAERLAGAVETIPPQVPPTGERDEIEVPDPGPALALRASRKMEPLARDSSVSRPVFLSAYRMGGEVDREFKAEGDVELRKIGTVVQSDRLTYWPVDDEVEAEGDVRLEQGSDVVTGPKMRLKLKDQVGFFEQPVFSLKREPTPGSKTATEKAYAAEFNAQQGRDWWNSGFAPPLALKIKPGQTKFKESVAMVKAVDTRGSAKRIDFEGENQIRLSGSTFTTCAPGNDDWYVETSDLKLDYDREVAEGHDGKVVFKGVPIFYSPWLSFSLNNQRKSGFLAPSYGTSSDSGFELALPYYWNIAPNMDATISPRIMSKRGVQLRNEFRYLDTAFGGFYRGQAQVEILPDDRQRDGERRYGLSLQHTQTTAKGFTGQINYNKVSDDNYYTDLSSGISSTSQTQLLQQGLVSYGGGGWWTATANFQQYQTLQPDKDNPVLEQYRMLPQLTFNARRPDFYSMDASLLGQYTFFTKARQIINGVQIDDPDGKRTVLYPQIALPYVRPGWYVTPKLGVNVRHYALSGQSATIPDSISVTLPIFSVDSGMTFERSSNWFGRDYTQTLEPRLFYLNVPYKNQDKIPIFDTALADFNFAQIFSENQFNGWDRVSNANQVTAGLSTRLIEPSSGSEIMRAMVGQRFYFSQNKVGLTPQNTVSDDENKWDSSDFLASFSGQILPRVYADTAVQYNWGDREVKRYSLGVRYQPEPGKVLNAAYRYNTDPNAPVDQIDVSGQWPISGPLYGVGRINYSLRDTGTDLSTGSTGGRIIESLAGLEYNGGCWVLRGVVRRQALTEDKTSTAFFIQLELSDFARVGSNPLSLLKRSVQGYGLINQPVADPVFGE